MEEITEHRAMAARQMKQRGVGGARSGKKSISRFLFAAVGLAMLSVATIAKGAIVEEGALCNNPGQPGDPCSKIASPASEKESDFMNVTRSPGVSDPTTQPIDGSAAVFTRPATFALG